MLKTCKVCNCQKEANETNFVTYKRKNEFKYANKCRTCFNAEMRGRRLKERKELEKHKIKTRWEILKSTHGDLELAIMIIRDYNIIGEFDKLTEKYGAGKSTLTRYSADREDLLVDSFPKEIEFFKKYKNRKRIKKEVETEENKGSKLISELPAELTYSELNKWGANLNLQVTGNYLLKLCKDNGINVIEQGCEYVN